jgi:hypothetical protein
MQSHVEGVSCFEWKAFVEDDMRRIKHSKLAFSQGREAVAPKTVPEWDPVLGQGLGEVGHETEPESAGIAAHRHATEPPQICPEEGKENDADEAGLPIGTGFGHG